MKPLIILILLFKTILISCQNETDLYLKFEKKKNKTYIDKTKSLNDLKIYSFITKNLKNQNN